MTTPKSLLLLSMFLSASAQAMMQAPKVYATNKHHFWIVSSANCRVKPEGDLFSCKPQRVDLQIEAKELPPLPYETKLKIETTPECGWKGRDYTGGLRVRLAQFVQGGEQDDFLRDEYVSALENRCLVLNQESSLAFKGLTITPRFPKEFRGATFPKGCKISVKVELNRIALKHKEDGDAYLRVLRKQSEQLALLKRSLKVLGKVQNATVDQKQDVQDLFDEHDSNVEEFQEKWKELLEFARSIDAKIDPKQNFVLGHELRVLIASMGDLSGALNKIRNGSGSLDPRFDEVFEELTRLLALGQSRDIQGQLEALEVQLSWATRSLDFYFSDSQYPRCCEDLEDLLFSEICETHGVLDVIRKKLCKKI